MGEEQSMVATVDITQAVKTALRISHNKLDDEIGEWIAAAQKEMRRVNIGDIADDTEDPLIREAIKTYCQMRDTKDMQKYDRFAMSWAYQIDNLRKSEGYREGV